MNDTQPAAGGAFESGGANYARYRPTYPKALADSLGALAPARGLAIDVGCGTGQLSVDLGQVFEAVLAVDPSADQLANALAHPKVRYAEGSAEALPAEDASADLVTVAQAAHWFDLPVFYEEVRRVARPGAVLALITYGVPFIDGPAQERFHGFYWDELFDHWPAERRLVENSYRDLAFPFTPLEAPDLVTERDMPLDAFLSYLETWSGVKAARRTGHGALVDRFEDDVRAAWGPPETAYRVTWPITQRQGRL